MLLRSILEDASRQKPLLPEKSNITQTFSQGNFIFKWVKKVKLIKPLDYLNVIVKIQQFALGVKVINICGRSTIINFNRIDKLNPTQVPTINFLRHINEYI